MKRTILITSLLLVLLVVLIGRIMPEPTPSLPYTPAPEQQEAIEQTLGQLPLYFIENQGQLDEQVAYYVQGRDTFVYFTATGVTIAQTTPTEPPTDGELFVTHDPARVPTGAANAEAQRWSVKLDFVGANPHVRPIGEEKTEAVISYFKGQPEDWHAGLPTYSRVVYPDLWPGIDLVYEGIASQLKYTFIVQPGADPAPIRLAYRGATDVTLNAAGQMEVQTPIGGFTDDTPVAYQEINGEHVPVEMAYVLDQVTADAPARPSHTGKQLADTITHPFGFHIGNYDPTRPLILDPIVILYAGYIGGSGSDFGRDIAIDGAGNAYIVGDTTSEGTFPVQGGLDSTFNGGAYDAFVVKVNSSGDSLIYAGYIGGSAEEYGYGIAVDGAGNAYVTGQTESTQATFPVLGGPDLSYNGGAFDAFVAKVSSSGNSLVYAGYIGGLGDDFGHDIAVDGSSNTYITGFTRSTEASFPVLGGPDLTFNGGNDAFVARVSSSGISLVYAGYIGGSDCFCSPYLVGDIGNGIAVDGSGNAYITGSTDSTEASFPVLGGPDLAFNGDPFYTDAFVAKVSSDASLVYAGYIGGSYADSGSGIAVDGAGNAYITGLTNSTEASFPVLGGPDLTFNGGNFDAFVVRVSSSGASLVYAGYIGGSNDDIGEGIAVGGAGNAYVTGETRSTEASFPVLGGPDLTFNGGDYDAFVVKVNSSGSSLNYAGYIGGSGIDYGHGIAVDGTGNAYVTGITGSTETSFPVLGGPILTYNGGEYDAFVVKHETIYKVYLPVTFNNYPPCFLGPMEQEPNNNRTGANGPLCFGRQYQGRPDDANDYFYFELGSPGSITVDLTNHVGQGLQLLLYYGANTSPIAQDFEPPYHTVLPNNQPGRYYVRIYSTGGFAQSPLYQLTVNAGGSALRTP